MLLSRHPSSMRQLLLQDLVIYSGYTLKAWSFWIAFSFVISNLKIAEASGQLQVEILSVRNIVSDDKNGPCCVRGSSGQSALAVSVKDPRTNSSLPTPSSTSIPPFSSTSNRTASTSSPSQCSGACRPYFRMCFKQFQRNVLLSGDCLYGSGFSPILTLPYVSPSVGLLGLISQSGSSPVNLTGSFVTINLPFDFAWMKSYTLILELLNAEGETSEHSVDTSIEQAVQSEELGPVDGWRTFTHSGNRAEIKYRVRVVCDEFYGNVTCAAFCQPRNDNFGHWYCSPNGAKVCIDGWMGSDCDKVRRRIYGEPGCVAHQGNIRCQFPTQMNKAICAPGCQNGDCSLPGECRCRTGFSGINCDICTPAGPCKHGTCKSSSYECICEKNWGGPMCDRDLNYCASHSPCFNYAVCHNVDNGQVEYECRCPEGYGGVECSEKINPCQILDPCERGECYAWNGTAQCKCPVGWDGMTCDKDIDECEDSPCANGGICRDLVGHHECDCVQGFTGDHCTERTVPEETIPMESATLPYLPIVQFERINASLTIEGNMTEVRVESSPTKAAYVDSTTVVTAIVSVILVLVILLCVLIAIVLYRRRQRQRGASEFMSSQKYAATSNNQKASKDLLKKDPDLIAHRHNMDNEVKLKILNNVLNETKIPVDDNGSTKSDDSLTKINLNRYPSTETSPVRYISDPGSSSPQPGYDQYIYNNKNRSGFYNDKDSKNSFMESLRAARTNRNHGSVGMEYFGDGKAPVEDFTVV